jgi:hypothetical protein
VELVALLPLIGLLAIAGLQVVVTLHVWGAARESARAGARGAQVGAPASDAVRAALPRSLARVATVHLSTSLDGSRRVRVRVPVPSLAPWIPLPAIVGQAESAP